MKIFTRFMPFALALFVGLQANAQDGSLLKLIEDKPDSVTADPYVKQTFQTTRLINAITSETLNKRQLDFRVTHRFGNFGGEGNWAENFFGFDEASNIRISFDYGITDRLTVGIGRSKINALLDGFVKYRWIRQTTDNKIPVSV